MKLRDLQRNWDAFGRTDPLWAIYALPDKKGGRWDEAAFFRTGVDEIAGVLHHVKDQGFTLARGRALDFGCGVGRLTQALADHFAEVCGVDIAPSMITLAEQYNRHGVRCRYYLNPTADLRLFPAGHFDFIYTNIVLQHMKPHYARRYLREFLRILRPGGLLLFQLPSHLVPAASPRLGQRVKESIKRRLPPPLLAALRRRPSTPPAPDTRAPDPTAPVMEMYGIPRRRLETWLVHHGARILDVTPDRSAGPDWVSFRYSVTRD